MNHRALRCETEKFLKARLCPLGIALSKSAYCTIDRLDYREDENLYTVDYKTSLTLGNPTEIFLWPEGYFPQLIFYRWIVEQELGQKVKAAMVCAPLADREHKYVKVDADSLDPQRKVIRQGKV